jgi:hypothetical protein
MMRNMMIAALLATGVPVAAAEAQSADVQSATGTRLDIVATGEVTRVPDVASISAGVTTRAATPTEAIAENARRMKRIVAALIKAGVAERDIQTNYFNLNPEMSRSRTETPVLTGYNATNQVTVRFRDIAHSGRILDALVAEGANQINGPTLSVDKPEAGLDQARLDAIAKARARAQLYARAIGKRVGPILSISEQGGGFGHGGSLAGYGESRALQNTTIVPGEQQLSVTLGVSFRLD